MCHGEKSSIQPPIIIVGTPMNPKETIVFFDYLKYKVYSIFHAVDLTLDVAFFLLH